MATRVEISCINKSDRFNPHERIINVGGVTAGGTRWKLSQTEAIHYIVKDTYLFYVNRDGNKVNVVIATSREANQVFPLYLYTTPEETAGTLFAQSEVTRKANLAPEFIKALEEKLKVTVTSDVTVTSGEITPEDIFYYAYAVFHSPTYRTRYAEFLKIDFPRLPLTSDKKLFAKLATKGKELVELHLLKSSNVDDFVTTYPEAGDNKVEKVAFANEPREGSKPSRGLGRVWINTKQYFGNVPEEVWEFKVGGYQVCEKWLKDRKGRVLSSEDITHYQRVVVALKETIRLMKEIDKSIVKWPME